MSLVLFGSFGDIATLADIALKIGLALNDCAGALTEFKDLVTEVEAFASSVLQIKATLSSRQRLPCALTVAIGDALDICFDLLKRTHARIDQFNSKTSRAVGVAVLRKYWAVPLPRVARINRRAQTLKTPSHSLLGLSPGVSSGNISEQNDTLDAIIAWKYGTHSLQTQRI
ncbi:hypothetical protein EXIGLDRAFT_761312 [Exidia glandulosa HHB12029]|uniref:Fungal N-terminal domain-containing protein n=1 Tax=Exidia glandulosa HHB12029 TaxID=1314781 RepID=A0A165NHH6_EXIGL|nr:hypothetical protein EXIGLDRAFT_761312 [Exidia glandulosa HHB12029]